MREMSEEVRMRRRSIAITVLTTTMAVSLVGCALLEQLITWLYVLPAEFSTGSIFKALFSQIRSNYCFGWADFLSHHLYRLAQSCSTMARIQ